jgi:NADH-quinone oxidoreductase subunit J
MHEFLFWTIALGTGLCAIATVVTQNIVRAATWLLFTLGGTSGIFFLLGADLVGAIQLLVYVGGTLVLVVFGVMLTAQGPFINMRSSSAEWAASATVGVLLMGVLAFTALAIRNDSGEAFTLSRDYRLGLRVPSEAELNKGARDPRMHPLVRYKPADRLIRLTPARLKIEEDYASGTITLEARDQAVRDLDDDRHAAARSPYTAAIGQGLLGRPVGPAHVETVDGISRIRRTHYLFPFEIVSVHLLVVLIGAAYLARAKRRRDQSPTLAGGPEVLPVNAEPATSIAANGTSSVPPPAASHGGGHA